MAEDSAEQNKRPKRRLRAASETVRERTEKLQQKASAPKKPSLVRAFFGGFLWPLRIIGRFFSKLGRFRVFRWIGYILLPPYIRNSWKELLQVTWPDRRKTFQLTNAVIIFSVLFGVIIALVDFVLNKVFKEIIVK